jgi:IMP and pyridine-specific 5'-nucleotidase
VKVKLLVGVLCLAEPVTLTIRSRYLSMFLEYRLTKSSEWIKGLLAVPFVLHSQPTGVFEPRSGSIAQMVEEARRRYVEIMKDIEDMIDDHSKSYTPS